MLRQPQLRWHGSDHPANAPAGQHILDVLEMAGSQHRAGVALSMHQSTMCRSIQLMQSQFRLARQAFTAVCRYGHHTCLEYQRLAYREHRLKEGLLCIGTDVLHQLLLTGLEGIQPLLQRFRCSDNWAELVRHSLLDEAIVSSLSLGKPLPAGQQPQWEGLLVV
jgi:hypothetical protein